MKADILTVKALFQRDVRYVIPTFQRPYVWNQEDQWDPLWNDVRNIAEEYLDQLQDLGEDKQAVAEKRTGTHFLGAVVLQQQATPTAELETRQVIDGQQRLITLQLLLDAAQEVFEHDGWAKESRQLRKLVVNDEDYGEDDPDKLFKIWPTLFDRDSFRRAMSNDLVISGFEDAAIVQAHEFFKLQIRTWLEQPLGVSSRRGQALVAALLGLLEIVVIDLTAADDANVIFETLNARGTPLLDSDLIKNSILHKAAEDGLNSDDIYRQYWQGFDEVWWRTDIRQGRLVRPRIDVYLSYWLTMRTVTDIQSARFFPKFREYAEGRRITEVVADIRDTGEAFRQLDSINDWSPEGEFLYRWRAMDAGVSSPVIMWLFSNRGQVGEQRFQRALRTIESFLVRRTLCRMTTRDYNRLFLDLLEKLDTRGDETVDDIVFRFLAGQKADSRIWPADGDIANAFFSLPLYQLLTRGRLRMALEGLEDALRSPKSEEEHVPRGILTIEHVMPQAWRDHWPLGGLDQQNDLEAAQERDRLVHTIGNLTLVTRALNPALSNSGWAEKRVELEKHTVLHLNKGLLSSALDIWDESRIRERGGHLAALVASVWPAPS